MTDLFFVLALALFMALALAWGYRTLPGENWQMLAALPLQKCDNGQWKGLNLTWYGFLSATAYTFGVGILIILAGATGIRLSSLVVLTLLLLAVTIPASKIIARLVEKKPGTLTVGGAVFVGVVSAPWLIVLVNMTLGKANGFSLPVPVMLAAISIAYTFGEALGRLACISFGCCYGPPLAQCSPFTQRIFAGFNLIFYGKTKKAAYADGLDEKKLLPIQMITAVIYTISGLIGTWLFLKGAFGAAFMATLWVTQVWRVISEFFRADFRGSMNFSMYQIMALGAIVYSSLILPVFSSATGMPDLNLGLGALWDPGIILFLELVWIAAFLHSGKSAVTDSRILFNVVRDKI
ncbi:MAG: prolipoprotein diacylglyceryl transferase [Desulfobacterium sp.]|nr:prolipoprotein diacylglyceryl transferase [Desulfobacterium sp.]